MKIICIVRKDLKNMKKIIKCRFLDENNEPRGKEYSYYSNIPVEVGQLVDVPAPVHFPEDENKTKTVIVSSVDVLENEIAAFADKIKTIVGIHTENQATTNKKY